MKCYKHYPLETIQNCRDLGGYPTADGGVTRFGVLIRSENPKELSKKDLNLFRQINLTDSVDLRSSFESNQSPSCFEEADFVNYHRVSVLNDRAALGSETEKPRLAFTVEAFKSINWIDEYAQMLDSGTGWVKEIFDIVVEAKGAVHFHCATGKDRTGLFSMLMLAAVGCGTEDIVENYVSSEIYMRSNFIQFLDRTTNGDFTGEYLNYPFFRTLKETMYASREHIDKKYGGIQNYLSENGVTEDTLRKLKAKFVEY